MSVEMPHSVSVANDEVEIPESPEEVFPKVLANASLCCQQCYRRLRSQHRLPKHVGQDHGDLMSFVTMDLPPGARWEILEAEWFETVQLRERLEKMHPPGESDSGTGCCFCGAVRPHRSPPTRSRSEAIRAAVGISMTLQELSVAHNPLALLVEVGEAKRDPDMAGDDFSTFRTATERAVRAGRRPR
jgi:hypothetical protein